MELMLPNDDRETPAERLEEVARLPIASVARELVEIIGPKRTAVVGGVKDTRRVQDWIRGERPPRKPEVLRAALQAARLIADKDGQRVAEAWFSGCNQHFGFAAPMLVLRDSDAPETYASVVRAAFEFAHR